MWERRAECDSYTRSPNGSAPADRDHGPSSVNSHAATSGDYTDRRTSTDGDAGTADGNAGTRHGYACTSGGHTYTCTYG